MAVNADGSVIIEADFDVSKAEKEFKSLSDKIEKAEEKLNTDKGKQSNIGKELRAARDEAEKTMATIDRLKAELAEAQEITSMKGTAGKVSPLEFMQASEKQARVSAELKTQEALLKEQDKTAEKIAGQYAKITDKVISGTKAIDAQKVKAGELAQQIDYANAAKAPGVVTATGTAINNAGESLKAFNKRITGLLKRVFVFSVITAAFRALRDYLSKVIKTNNEATAAIAKLKGALLTLAQPLVNVIIPALITFVNILTNVFAAIARIVSMIFGTTLSASKESAKNLNAEIAGIEGVGDAAEEAAQQLAGFDEINTIATEEKTDGGSGGGGGVSDTILPDFNFSDKLSDKMRRLAAAILTIGAGLAAWKIAKSVLDWFNMLAGGKFKNINKLAAGIGLITAGLALELENIASIRAGEYDATSLESAIKSAISGVLAGAGLVALGAGLWAIPVAVALMFVITDVAANWENYQAMQQGVLDSIGAVFSGDTGGFWESVTDTWLTWFETDGWTQKLVKTIVGEQVWENAKKFVSENGLAEALSPTLDPIIEKVGQITSDIKLFFEDTWDNIKQTWEDASTWFDLNVIQPTKRMFEPIRETLGGIFEGSKLIVEAAWIVVPEWFNNKVIQPVVGFFKPIVEKIGNFFKTLWEGIKTVWSVVAEWFKNKVLDPIKNAFKLAFEGIKSIVKGIINNIIGFVEKMINRVISAINTFLSGFNRLATAAGKIVGKDFSGVGKLSYVSLPRLAQGAVIPPNREFMAVLGDQKQGTNIEAPLETIKQALAEVLQGGNGGTMEVKLYLDGKQIARNSVKHINSMTMAAGKPVILT